MAFMQELVHDPGGVARDAPRPQLVPGIADEATGDADHRLDPRQRPLVLVVDDEASIRLLCRVNLRLEGMDTAEAGDGEGAIRLAHELKPDLILLDVMMPQVDGWQVAEALAGDDDTRELPIVFLSARAEPADYLHGYGLGAVGYVTKPFDPTALGAILQDALERVGRGERDDLRRERMSELGERLEP
jgi:two-component system, OmpR family, response regulator